MAFLVVKFTFSVTEITVLGADIRLLVAKITFVAAEKLLKWPISICSGLDNFSVAETSLFVPKISSVMADITI